MKFITSLLSTNKHISSEFNNSDCKCIQQNLDLSDLAQVNSKRYKKSKKRLKESLKEAMRSTLKTRDQKEMFDLF